MGNTVLSCPLGSLRTGAQVGSIGALLMLSRARFRKRGDILQLTWRHHNLALRRANKVTCRALAHFAARARAKAVARKHCCSFAEAGSGLLSPRTANHIHFPISRIRDR